MNDLDYLNQISAGVPSSKPVAPFFDKKTKTVLGIVAVAIVAIIVLFTVSSSAPKPLEADAELGRIYNRSSSLLKTIDEYNRDVKSSSLRAAGSSLQTVLLELQSGSNSLLESYYGVKADSYPLTGEDSSLLEGTNSNLEKARLNGLLDRHYASELAYQFSHLMIVEDQAISKSSSHTISEFLEDSKSSLTQLQETFASFSESN